MIKISKRLKEVANLTLKEKSNGIIDVGCDHALLDIYLLQNNNDLRIVASDLRKKPLENARKNIEKYSFLNKIEIRLQDGIDILDDYIDTILISGMGQETIVDILERDKNKLNNINRLIISSNNKFPIIREKISALGFTIKDEVIVYEEGIYYIIMEFVKGTSKYSKEELFFGPILLNKKDDMFYEYYSYLKNINLEILKKIPKDNERVEEIENNLKLLDSII